LALTGSAHGQLLSKKNRSRLNNGSGGSDGAYL